MNRRPPFAVPRRPRVGNAYYRAAVVAMAHPEWALVHGSIGLPYGRRLGHAWTARGGWIFDPERGHVLPASAYKLGHDAIEFGRFPGSEASTLCLRYGSWGPWFDREGKPLP